MSDAYDPSRVGWKSKTFICIIIIVACMIAYFVYKNKNKPPTSLPSTTDTLNIVKKNLQKGIYFYRKETNTLYFKSSDDFKYYKVKDGDSCSLLIDQAIIIKDIYRIYKCSEVPPQFQKPMECATNPDSYTSILYQSADDYEAEINKNIGGEVVPDLITCTGSSSGASEAKTNAYVNELNSLLKKNIFTIEDYLSSKKEDILGFVKNLGILGAVSLVMKEYTILYMILPQFCSGDPVQQAKGGIFLGFEITKNGVEKMSTWLKKLSEDSEKQDSMIAEKDGQVLIEKTWTNVAIDCGGFIRKGLTEMLESVIAICSKLLSYAEGLMMIGMILDALDPCNLNTGYMTQNVLDSYKRAYDKSFQYNMSNLGYGIEDPFRADNLCDFTYKDDSGNTVPLMNSSSYWDNCISDDDKKNKKKEDFTKAEDDLFTKYVNEYFDNLTVNSQGQKINKNITNDVIAKLFEKCVGGNVDWNSLNTITKDELKATFKHSDNIIENVELIFTGENVLLAAYIDQYFWAFLLFLIILIFTVYFV